MRHHWWWTSLLINLLERAVRRDPFIDDWLSAFDGWKRHIQDGKILEQFIRKEPGDFYALMDLASFVYSGRHTIPNYLWSFEKSREKHIGLCITIEWDRQTEARHAFGGVFPEHVKRGLTTEDTKVIRNYTWVGNVDDTVIYVTVKFCREAVDGEKVDGCIVSVKRHSCFMPEITGSSRTSRYATLSCPMKER